MSFVFDNEPCLQPTTLAEGCRAAGIPVGSWSGRANVYNCPLRSPGHGFLLVKRKWIDQRDFEQGDKFRALQIFDGYGNSFELKKVLVIGHSNAVTPGARGDEDTAYLLEVTDRRWLFWDRGTPITDAYNLRTDADGEYITTTLNFGTAWTWQQILNDIWPTELGSAPTIPFTPHGTPEQIWFHNEFPLRAVDYLLTRLACALKYNPFTDVFTIVRLGHATTGETARIRGFLNQLNDFRIWDQYAIAGRTAKYPQTVRVQFRVKKPYTDGTAPYYNVNHTVQPTAASINAGTVALLEDDLVAQYDGSSVTNSSALTARALERYTDWLRKRQMFDTGDVLSFTGAWPMYWTQPAAAVGATTQTGTVVSGDQFDTLKESKGAKGAKEPKPAPFDIVGQFYRTVIWDGRADIRTQLLSGEIGSQDLENWRRCESTDSPYYDEDCNVVSRVMRTMPSQIPTLAYDKGAQNCCCGGGDPDPVPGPIPPGPGGTPCCWFYDGVPNTIPNSPCGTWRLMKIGSHGNNPTEDCFSLPTIKAADCENGKPKIEECLKDTPVDGYISDGWVPVFPYEPSQCLSLYRICGGGAGQMPPGVPGKPKPPGGGGQSCVDECMSMCFLAYGFYEPQCVVDCVRFRCQGNWNPSPPGSPGSPDGFGGGSRPDHAIQIYTTQIWVESPTAGYVLTVQSDGTVVQAAAAGGPITGTLGAEVFYIQSTATNDDPRVSWYQNRAATTDATVATLHSWTLADDTLYLFTVEIIGRRTGGSAGAAGDSFSVVFGDTWKRTSGGGASRLALTIAPEQIKAIDRDNVNVSADIDSSGNDVRVRITGDTNNNYTWHMTARVEKVST